MGGGTHNSLASGNVGNGLSPRGRGNQCPCVSCLPALRSIPAWAGEPRTTLVSKPGMGVYPRVGGGTGYVPYDKYGNFGLSPRGRGNLRGNQGFGKGRRSIPAWRGGTDKSRQIPLTPEGLSPRGRGNHSGISSGLLINRSIPAWAGEPCLRRRYGYAGPVYPRVGGGTDTRIAIISLTVGLSPRGRGETRPSSRTDDTTSVYPRVGGGKRESTKTPRIG